MSIDPMTAEHGIAYLHGFASSPGSRKGVALARTVAERCGIRVHLPDLNNPSFGRLTMTGALARLDDLDREVAPRKWRFVGSSMGGWLAARWAELNPDRVDRLLLLCPGFDLAERWPEMLNQRNWRRWRLTGSLPFPDALGRPTPVHWGLVEDARRHPGTPVVPCRTHIIHGTCDAVVPVELTRRYAAAWPDAVSVLEVDDEHPLGESVGLVTNTAIRFLVEGESP